MTRRITRIQFKSSFEVSFGSMPIIILYYFMHSQLDIGRTILIVEFESSFDKWYLFLLSFPWW